MASLMDQALLELPPEPYCNEFVQYLYLQQADREFVAEFRRMERRLINGHTCAAAVKPSKHTKHRWR